MQVSTIPNVNYGGFWPDGGGYTSATLPAGESGLLYFQVSQDQRVVGKAQVGNRTPYWDGATWRDLGTSTGVSPAAFHPMDGSVYVSDADGVRVHARDGQYLRTIPGYIGSQGIRWVSPDGSVVSGDATYGVVGLLGEYTQIQDVLIGQGLAGGLDVVVGGQRRHVCDGVVQFLRVNAVGDRVACYWTDFRNGYLLQTTLGELRALPIVVVQPSPAPIPSPVPPPVSPSPKEPVMPTAPNRLDVVRSVIAAHPEIDRVTDGVRGAITALVVQALGGLPWGRKDRDRDPNNNNNSDDALCYRLPDGSFEIYDILSGSDGAAQWDYKGTFADGANGYFREVPIVSTGGNSGSGGPSPSVPAGSVGQALDTKLAALQSTVDSLKTSLDNLWSRFQALESRVVAPAAPVNVSLNGRVVSLRARANGKFVCADDRPDRPLLANRDGNGEWESFEILE